MIDPDALQQIAELAPEGADEVLRGIISSYWESADNLIVELSDDCDRIDQADVVRQRVRSSRPEEMLVRDDW